jgi:hypothetical protein
VLAAVVAGLQMCVYTGMVGSVPPKTLCCENAVQRVAACIRPGIGASPACVRCLPTCMLGWPAQLWYGTMVPYHRHVHVCMGAGGTQADCKMSQNTLSHPSLLNQPSICFMFRHCQVSMQARPLLPYIYCTTHMCATGETMVAPVDHGGTRCIL